MHRLGQRLDCVRQWLARLQLGTLYVEPGSPWENGYIESFNGKLRDELVNGEIFGMLLEAKVLIERWPIEYKTHWPHSALGHRPPGPEAVEPVPRGSGTTPLRLVQFRENLSVGSPNIGPRKN